MDRRMFLKVTGGAAVCVIVGGYPLISRLAQDQFDAFKTGLAGVLVQQLGDAQGKAAYDKVLQELPAALAALPNVGTPSENKWASNMAPAALALAAYRALVPGQVTLPELGQMFYRTMENEISGLPALIMRATYNESAAMEQAKQLSAFFQKRQYPENWVAAFVEGNGTDFTFGLDVTECAIAKYHRAQGVPELSRYLCLVDNLTMGAQGRGLVRFKTLAEGCEKCDFRFKQGRATWLAPLRDGWPPKFGG